MKIAIGLSGGVDSAVAAYLLKKQGFEVVGITLLLTGNEITGCEDAKQVAATLGIEHHILDRRKLFAESVIMPFIDEYQNGRTPNPCIECNKIIKFGAMLDYAEELGCEKIATGHYAKITEKNGEFILEKADSAKDQSYFLYRLNQHQLSKIMLPVTDLTKDETRALALEAGIPVAQKKDSQEICFVPDDDYIAYLASLGVTAPQGDILFTNGEKAGTHSGIINYTIGQRKGIGAYGKPMFVTKIDAPSNTVTIGENGEQYGSSLIADRATFIDGKPLTEPIRGDVKIRFRAKEQPALITPVPEGFRVDFDTPQRSITPGQSAVIYIGNRVVGGGRIV